MVAIRTRPRRRAPTGNRSVDAAVTGTGQAPPGPAGPVIATDPNPDPDLGPADAGDPAPATVETHQDAPSGGQTEGDVNEILFGGPPDPAGPDPQPTPPKKSHHKLKRPTSGRSSAPPDPSPQPKKTTKAPDSELGKLLLMVMESMTVAQLGERARFAPNERALIEPALSRMLERMTPTSAAAFARIADPVMLATGLLLWGARVFGGSVPDGVRPTPIRPQPAPATQPATGAAPSAGDGAPSDDLADAWARGY